MPNLIWTYVIAGLLAAHGVGHAAGPWLMRRSWLAPRIMNGPARWLFIGEWLLAGIVFVAAALGLLDVFVAPILWRGLAIAGALLSGLAALLYANRNEGRPLFNAIGMNIIVLVALLVFDWPPVSLVGD
jgi:hypothetical protein